MTEQTEDPQLEDTNLTRAFSIPIFALFFAVLLINTRPIPGDSNAIRWITFPDTLGGDSLRNGLRNIAITFGLSCFPGAVIGTGLAWLIARHAKLATGSLLVLRICQWAPFLFWWVLSWALIYAPSERPGRYFFVWTMGIPAVALGSCYHIVCLRMLASLDWQRSLSETASLAIHRGIYISIVLTLSVSMEYWVAYRANDNLVRHYVAALILMLFLFIANWTTRSDVSQSAELRKQLVLNGVLRGNHGAFLSAALIVAALGVSWQLLSALGYFRVSLSGIVSAIPTLFSTSDILSDISTSLLEIFAGCVISGLLVLIISPFISPREPFHK